ncbi:lysozyme 1 isoform X2 [Amyelois transitella]|uniref:lysozyme 1 isoform X1 n=1 Tax=Amyelois transitella TaxID=680683 RepID=UPI00067DEA98|nr:lysozyme 1 isoform X1 [Amyelois transitella]XP_060804852.1 lysozyme 1 isoform X2 [Amyelois transitella]
MRFECFIVCIWIYLVNVCGVHISNLNEACFRCLCHVVGCDMSHGCSGGYCGPFYISRVYWVDAGKPTLPDDDANRTEAFQDCARDYYCSIRIVESYMAKFGKDCNNDGVTNCYDYMMINYHGGAACSMPLYLTVGGLRWLDRYKQCKF